MSGLNVAQRFRGGDASRRVSPLTVIVNQMVVSLTRGRGMQISTRLAPRFPVPNRVWLHAWTCW
jgi:hypothetical protein